MWFVGSIPLRLEMFAVDRAVSSHIASIGLPSGVPTRPAGPVPIVCTMHTNEDSVMTDRPGEGRMQFDGKTASTGPEEVRGT